MHFRNPKILALGNIFFPPVIARAWAEMGGWVGDDTWKSLKKIEFCMDLSSVPLKVLRVSTQNGHLLCYYGFSFMNYQWIQTILG